MTERCYVEKYALEKNIETVINQLFVLQKRWWIFLKFGNVDVYEQNKVRKRYLNGYFTDGLTFATYNFQPSLCWSNWDFYSKFLLKWVVFDLVHY